MPDGLFLTPKMVRLKNFYSQLQKNIGGVKKFSTFSLSQPNFGPLVTITSCVKMVVINIHNLM